jgi:hypothetical protein
MVVRWPRMFNFWEVIVFGLLNVPVLIGVLLLLAHLALWRMNLPGRVGQHP